MSLFKYFKPKYYKYKKALRIINEAIDIYKVNNSNINRFLCRCIKKAYFNIYHKEINTSEIQSIIPEFNCKYLKGYNRSKDEVCSPYEDVESRFESLNKLRNLYIDKIAKL